MPHLDPADRITRAYAAEQARKAKIDADRAANEASIREGVESGSAGVGGTFDEREKRRADLEDWGRANLSPEELYPEHFPEGEVDDEYEYVYTHYVAQGTMLANKGGTMSGVIAITNPSDESAEAGIVETHNGITPRGILEEYGSRLEDGAQIVMTGEESGRVWQYIATREKGEFGSIALRSNNGLAANDEDRRELSFIEFVAGGYAHGEYIIETGDYPLETVPVAELETFTVFGINDDDEPFTAVVSATEDTVREVGVQAGLVDAGFESIVKISAILKGDHIEDAVTL